tara:strand:- start:105 stop:386 length:282 start_codon:yes stop_codon:yes gene_type:complete
MAVENWIHECARRMLDVDDLHLDVRNYLDEIEMYANLAGGSIQSRQVVAMALVHYHDRKELKNEVKWLRESVLDITTILKRLTREAGWNPDDE